MSRLNPDRHGIPAITYKAAQRHQLPRAFQHSHPFSPSAQHPAPSMPTANPPTFRALWIRRLLWASIPISLITMALSLVNLAWTSFYTSPAVAVLALAFDITLLALSAKERKASGSSPSPETESPLSLPSVCRAGTIVCGYLLAVFWLGVFITSIMWVVITPPLDNPVHTEDRFPAAYVEIAFIGTHIILFSVLGTFCALERKAIRNRRSMEPIIPHNPADPVAAELYARRIQQLLWGSLALCAVILALSLVMLASTTFYLSPASVVASAAFTVTLLVLTGRERKAAKAKAQPTGIPLTQTPSKAVSTTELMAEYFAVNGKLPFTSRALTISFGIFITVLCTTIGTLRRIQRALSWGSRPEP
ncbi:hypothetical protein FA13DRAFT_1457504 [Coprinellus micaceus]|uniref:Uncharacterized protein n=1 Tax=Coprinellus micaceus TaxID=71717 RepID=A0A4Y7SP57_COPMI|nr:hypothetical protein FA13DRAFT_1457504 [Coprinellus micaceus]